jgi:glutamyl-tRNA reductase
MIYIADIGMNHETAPVELRECLAKDPSTPDLALASMREESSIKEGLFISTCNRVEALFTTDRIQEAEASVISILSRLGQMPVTKFSPHLFTHRGREAVRHVFRVASSLDSMVVGEPQILGQNKEAYVKAAGKRPPVLS